MKKDELNESMGESNKKCYTSLFTNLYSSRCKLACT